MDDEAVEKIRQQYLDGEIGYLKMWGELYDIDFDAHFAARKQEEFWKEKHV